MSVLLVILGTIIGFASGVVVMAALAEIWIQAYTTRMDNRKAEFGNKRFKEGWDQGRQALDLEQRIIKIEKNKEAIQWLRKTLKPVPKEEREEG